MSSKKILLVAANPATSTTTGWPVGFWASELTHPYFEFKEAGFEIDLASPNGGKIEMDAMSNPFDESGYSASDEISKKFIEDESLMALLENTKNISSVNSDDYDAIVVVGGQSPMFTFKEAKGLQDKFLEFYSKGKTSAALCHGVSLLLYLEENGKPFVSGKAITGFANSEEDYADQAVGQKLMPFRIEDEANKLGANFKAGTAFESHAIQDGHLITGQQQNSGVEVAKLVIKNL